MYEEGYGVTKFDLKLRRIVGDDPGRAHSEAKILGSRLHVARRLANGRKRFEVESKWPKYLFSKRMPRWVAKSTSNFVGSWVPTSNLKCQWVVGMRSMMVHSGAASMRKGNHVPRRLEHCFCKDEVAWGSLKWGKKCRFWALDGGDLTSNSTE